MFQVTLVSGDASLITSLRGPLVDAGYEVVALAGSEESEPDPAAAADVLAVDWRGASLAAGAALRGAAPGLGPGPF